MGRLPSCEFSLNGQTLEIVNDFCYLGVNFSVQLSFSQHGRMINSKARSKCGLLFSRLPLADLPIDIVLELFDIFIIPTFTYSLSLWTSKCATSVFDSIDATYSKFLKRYLQVPAHSSNKIVHFLTSTIPLSKRLRQLAPHNIGALSFPPEMNGHRLTFLKGDNSAEEAENIYESILALSELTYNPD